MTFRASVERYLGAVAQQYHRGDAREESYYDVLKQLWEELGSQLSSAHATLTVLPRQTEAGNPDTVSYTHLRAHETRHDLVCRLLLEKKKKKTKSVYLC